MMTYRYIAEAKHTYVPLSCICLCTGISYVLIVVMLTSHIFNAMVEYLYMINLLIVEIACMW